MKLTAQTYFESQRVLVDATSSSSTFKALQGVLHGPLPCPRCGGRTSLIEQLDADVSALIGADPCAACEPPERQT